MLNFPAEPAFGEGVDRLVRGMLQVEKFWKIELVNRFSAFQISDNFSDVIAERTKRIESSKPVKKWA